MKARIRKVIITAICFLLIFFSYASVVIAYDSNYAFFTIDATNVDDENFTVNVSLDLTNCENVSGMTLFLYYDPKVFIFKSFVNGNDFTGADITNDAITGRVKMLWETTTPYIADIAALLSVNFGLSANAYDGVHEFSLVCSELYDSNFNEIQNSTDTCSVRIGEKFELYEKELNISVGESVIIIANKEIDSWISLDESIAKVDENGNIIAVSPGTTYLIAESGNEFDMATVVVKNETIIITSNVYKTGKTFITNLNSGTTVEELKRNIIGSSNIVVFDQSKKVVDEGIVKTGYTVSAINYGIATDSLIAVVDGDANGDGVFCIKDLVFMKKATTGIINTYSKAQAYAASGIEKNNLTSLDLVRIQKKLFS